MPTKGSIFFILFFSLQLSISAQIKTSFFHDTAQEVSIDSIALFKFEPFETKINRGLKNGTYWLKVENDGEERLIEISSARVRKAEAYIEGLILKKLPDFNMITYDLPPNKVMYLKVLCEKEGGFPVVSHIKQLALKNIQKQYLYYGLYYGLGIVIVILNLFYFFNFKEITFLYYSFFLTGILFTILFRDGLVPFVFNSSWLAKDGEVIFHFATVSFGILFASEYLRHQLHFPKLKFFAFLNSLATLIFFSIYIGTNRFIWFGLAQLSGITLLSIYWISSLLLFRKNTFSAFFAIAYSFILLLTIDFFILPIFGLPNLGITTSLMKISSVFEMLILSYAVVYRMRILQKENKDIQASLFKRTSQIEKLEEELNKLKLGVKNNITTADLSGREVEILTMIANGVPTKEMADKLFLSVNTIKYHVKNLYDKLEISSRQEAKLKAANIKGLG
ncbi:hypothetical protein EGI22_09300 [Lacihabitans sp. LS3-19]|uniref:7TM diverse intracellular signaling domain-containing protein n=1 Tax=Lacihabitans sp. LS3-19 TaxID=2487335 RepID=UPI0020CBF933|nr:7TM diverse intracellular signaling domain-containing protein [Lacihabitans sp. LS3-19]MCP9768108.1 hypothetical protein [Lacihabitans sp. LS3-19]